MKIWQQKTLLNEETYKNDSLWFSWLPFPVHQEPKYYILGECVLELGH